MRARELVTRKHVHEWKLTLNRYRAWVGERNLERTCETCRAVQRAVSLYESELPPEPLLALADLPWI